MSTAAGSAITDYNASMSVLAITLTSLGVLAVLSIFGCIGGWIYIKRRRTRQAAAAAEQQKAYVMNQPQVPYGQTTNPANIPPGGYYPQQYPADYPAQQPPSQGI